MKCSQCYFVCSPDFDFCPKCGTALQHTCSQCGFRAPADHAFCPRCGAALVPPVTQEEGDAQATLADALQRLVPKEYADRLLVTHGPVSHERRQVTILFSDVKGSSAMAEKLDPEEVLEIMNGAFEVLIAPVLRYEGTLARLRGDGILAFFGAPIAHEDDPERAIRAGLDTVEGASKYARQLEEERGIAGFDVRVGIHTGLVVVGEVGSDLRGEYTAMGDAVNLAARMESAAEPGTVLITQDTYSLIAPLFETQALGPIQVKGRTAPVHTYRVLSVKSLPGKPRGLPGLDSPLVGRQAEFEALANVLASLQTGVGGIVTLVGEAGIGKSRLVAELRASAPDSPVQWVEGRCLSYGTSSAYLLWRDVLRGLLGVTLDTPPATVHDMLQGQVQTLCPERFADVTPYLARLMALPVDDQTRARLDDLDGQDLRARTFHAVETLVASVAREHPLALVCEDLHWADPSSLELLEHLMPHTEQAALLIVCVFRPLKKHGSWRIKEAAARTYGHRHTDLELAPLSPAESATLVSHLLRVEDLPPGLKDRILEITEGNPFYVEEVLRTLIDSAAVACDETTGRWIATHDETDIAIPNTLQGVLLARIDRLHEETRRVLQMAAVIGRIFLYRVLTALRTRTLTAAPAERPLDEHLTTLQREEMIRERARIPELEYIFKHELTREAAYNGLLKKDRRVYHRQVAVALEQLFPERIDEQVGLLAYHWERAGDAEKATAYLLRAGDQARLAYAHAEAIDYYQRALAWLKKQGDYEQATRTLMKLGLTYHNAFDFQRARQAYDEGFILWQQAEKMVPIALSPAPRAFRMAWTEPPTLDPILARDTNSVEQIAQLFSGLVELRPDLGLVPDVARSWKVAADGRQYVFHLRDDVRWSDGIPVTAGDVEYAWKRALSPAIRSPSASLLYDIQGARAFHQGETNDSENVRVQARDALTLVVELEEPTSYFLHLLTNPGTYPVPRHAVETHNAAWTEPDHLVTNGPFRVESWRQGKPMALERNPMYHGRASGNVQRVERVIVPSHAVILEMYEADALDIIKFLPLADLDHARQQHVEEYASGPILATTYIGFDASRPPFNDVRVRQAFTLATDRDTLADVILRGAHFPATGGFVPPGMPGHSAGIARPYDPDQARGLLAQAGYSQRFPDISLLISGGEVPMLAAEYLQAQWRECLGVEVALEATKDWAMYLAQVRRDPAHMFYLAWHADYPDPNSFLNVGFPQSTGWRNGTYDKLVEKARRIADPEQRMGLYGQADRILVDEAPLLLLWYQRYHRLVKPWVRFPTSPLTLWLLKDVVIELSDRL